MPITNAVRLHDARERFIAAAGLDASGVPPKIASVLMGHATPARQPGAAQIELARYTHALPEDIEDTRDKLATYLTKHQEKASVRMGRLVAGTYRCILGFR